MADIAASQGRQKLPEHKGYVREHGEDMPDTRDWRWDAHA